MCFADWPRTDGVLSFATISLAIKVPRIANQRQQQVSVLIWGGVILVVYSSALGYAALVDRALPAEDGVVLKRRYGCELPVMGLV